MKKIVYIFVGCFLCATSCSDQYYSEGRVTTDGATDITKQSAILHGEVQIVTKGESARLSIPRRGFAYGTHRYMLLDTVNDIGSGEGNFHCDVKYLLPNTIYFVRAFAVVEDKSTVPFSGNLIEFTTADGETLPGVVTEEPSNVTTNSAILNGKIVSPGYPSYSARGFAYGFSQQPAVESSTTVSVTGIGLGSFSAPITGLTEGVVYYVRAYAISSAGTAYGEEISFKPGTPTDYVAPPGTGFLVSKTDIIPGTLNWDSANTLCRNTPIGGLSGWRLPTISELTTIYYIRTSIGGFKTGNNVLYWSSTIDGYDRYSTINFSNNGSPGSSHQSNAFYARCVRALP